MSIFSRKAKAWNEQIQFTGTTDIVIVNEEVKAQLVFLGITEDTLSSVREAATVLSPYKKEIINHFYENITSVKHLKGMILENSTVDRLRLTMETYLDQFLQADVNEEYIRTRVIVGHVHSRIHLTADHFISAHHLLIQMMTSIIIEKLHNKTQRMTDYVIAIQKLAAFDQQLIVEVYMEETFKTFLHGISNMLNHTTQLDTTGQLIKGMEQQIEETHNVTAATEEMSASIEEVASHAIKVAEGTDEAVQSAEQSKEIVGKSLDDIQKVGDVYEQVVGKVGQLDLEIENTRNVVQIIREIADQTNLLALNASIEAARAGEQGKGFAVVASEVRKLSEHTKEQIIQISANMESLQKVSTEVTQEINQTGKLVEQSVTGASFAGEALENIVATMKEINEATAQIAAMSEEQTSAVQDIAQRNTVINDNSVMAQNIAKQTAENVLDLSKEMETYRNTFFAINIDLKPKDIVKVAKTDHLLWKWKVYNMILGIETIDSQQVASHKECRLGKWYYGGLSQQVLNSHTFKQIEEPHKAVHDYAKLAVECYEQGDIHGAEEAFIHLQDASDQVITLLTKLELEL